MVPSNQRFHIGRLGGSDAFVAPRHAAGPRCRTLGSANSTARGTQSYSLRVGTLDRRAELVPSRQIWWRSALPWASDLNLPAAERLDRQ